MNYSDDRSDFKSAYMDKNLYHKPTPGIVMHNNIEW